jgi:DNA-binding response OmpR family regulator
VAPRTGGDDGDGGGAVRVLVVSEDVMERLRAVSALRLHAEAEVVEAGSAAEVRSMLLEDGEVFDVLVVDGDLQPRGGFAMLYDLRSKGQLAGTAPHPSLVMAARQTDRWLADWAGANDLLIKPVDPFELARRVAALEGAEVPPYGDAGAADKQVAAAMRDHVSGARG